MATTSIQDAMEEIQVVEKSHKTAVRNPSASLISWQPRQYKGGDNSMVLAQNPTYQVAVKSGQLTRTVQREAVELLVMTLEEFQKDNFYIDPEQNSRLVYRPETEKQLTEARAMFKRINSEEKSADISLDDIGAGRIASNIYALTTRYGETDEVLEARIEYCVDRFKEVPTAIALRARQIVLNKSKGWPVPQDIEAAINTAIREFKNQLQSHETPNGNQTKLDAIRNYEMEIRSEAKNREFAHLYCSYEPKIVIGLPPFEEEQHNENTAEA